MSNKLSNEKVSNIEFLQLVQKYNPTFLSQTSEWTKDVFSEKGFEAISRTDPNLQSVNAFFELSLRFVLNKIEGQNAVDTLETQGFGESYFNEYGAFLQRINVNEIKPINPLYLKLQNFGSVDPFKIRKPTSTERFFKINNEYQNLITIQDFEAKQIFINEFGMSEYISAILASLDNAYEVQKYVNKLEALNAGINSTVHPLLDTQIIKAPMSAEPTADELKSFILKLKNLLSNMKVTPASKSYNAMKFNRHQNVDDLRVLIRPYLLNRINTELLSQTFNPDKLNMNVQFVEVENFGGIKYTDTAGTELKPIYDELGCQIGFNASGTGEPLDEAQILTVDPNEKTLCIVADKGLVFSSEQNGYILRTIDNPAGLYRNYWAAKPHGLIAYDYAYTCVKFENET